MGPPCSPWGRADPGSRPLFPSQWGRPRGVTPVMETGVRRVQTGSQTAAPARASLPLPSWTSRRQVTGAYSHTHTLTHTYSHTHSHTHTHTRAVSHSHTHTLTHTHTHTHSHTHAVSHSHAHTHSHTHTHTHTHTHSHTHTHTHILTPTQSLTRTHTHTHSHTHTHTHSHTHTHTHTLLFNYRSDGSVPPPPPRSGAAFGRRPVVTDGARHVPPRRPPPRGFRPAPSIHTSSLSPLPSPLSLSLSGRAESQPPTDCRSPPDRGPSPAVLGFHVPTGPPPAEAQGLRRAGKKNKPFGSERRPLTGASKALVLCFTELN